MILWIVLLVVVLLIVLGSRVYKNLLAKREAYLEAFEPVDEALVQRYDLVPPLLASAKGQANRDLVGAVSTARNQAVTAHLQAVDTPEDPDAMATLSKADLRLERSLEALGEDLPSEAAVPERRALDENAERVAQARDAYNDAVMSYNVHRTRFPGSAFAGPMGFVKAPYLSTSWRSSAKAHA